MQRTSDLAFVLDGYNVLFQTPLAISDGRGDIDLESSRRRLIGFLSELVSRTKRSDTAVVFDSKQLKSAAPQISQAAPSLWVVFASHLDEADPYIEELIATHLRPKSLTVVTADRKILSTARSYAAVSIDPIQWYESSLLRLDPDKLDWIESGGSPGAASDSVPHPALPAPRTPFGPLDWPGARRRASRPLPEDPFGDLGEFELNR